MTLTVAHISPLMSLVAGLLILIMPRLLNLIIAVFLILNGLIGLGLLKWLHLYRAMRRNPRLSGLRGPVQNGVRRAISSPFH